MRLIAAFVFIIYCLLTSILAPFAVLFLSYQKRRDPSYGKRRCELLGSYPFGYKRCIWFHTVSVGEVIAARPLINAFVKRHPKLTVVVTTTTTTGAKEVSRINGVTHVYAPLDSPIAVFNFLRNFSPSHLFIMEAELWPCLLKFTKWSKAKIAIFNARMPEKTCVKYERYKGLTYHLLAKPLDMVICQGEDDAERFARIGVDKNKIFTTGSLKYDLTPNEELFRAARKIKKTWPEGVVIGAISTHPGEEEMLLECFYNLRTDYPGLRMVVVPRHLTGASRAEKFIQSIEGTYALRTTSSRFLEDFTQEILIGNTIGEMEFYLGLCDIVFMGGSLISIGGHNPLEPAYFGLPIVTGPHYFNFNDQYEKLIENRGAYVANDNRRLFTVFQMLLSNKELRDTTGMQAFDTQQEGRGALTQTLDRLETTLSHQSV